MMTVVFIVAILTILGIARYNKSVSLFFILLASILGGFAGGALINRASNSDDSDNTKSVQVQPMQNSPQGIGLFALVDIRDILNASSAGKAETPASDTDFGITVAPSKGIVLDVPENPPQIPVSYLDDS